MKDLIRRITRRGAESPPRESAAPHQAPEAGASDAPVPAGRREEAPKAEGRGEPLGPAGMESQTPIPKPPPELPLFFMLSHLDDDGPVRLDGVKLGVCEVMGLELDEPKLGAFAGALNALDFPAQLLIRQHPPRLGGMREKLKESQPDDLPPADEGRRRVPPASLDRP